MDQPTSGRILFITGTDTGVGKTVLTGLLLQHLRNRACRALAMKPFCSGGTGDVDLLAGLQDRELTPREVNPFYFPDPVAPLVAARRQRRRVLPDQAVGAVRELARRCEWLLVEGAGGLLAPLGEGFSAVDLVAALACAVVVAARNRLGVINHTLLTLSALRAAGVDRATVVLMGSRRPDLSARSNAAVLREMIGRQDVFSLGFLGPRRLTAARVRAAVRRRRRVLAGIIDRAFPPGRYPARASGAAE